MRMHRPLPAMMNYRESVERSAELLRLALPLMSRQAAGLHPVSYAVWYEYVAGNNRPLKAAIDELTRDGARLDEAARLLRRTDERITEIGLAVGFATPSHFATAFARRFGVPPSRYRAVARA